MKPTFTLLLLLFIPFLCFAQNRWYVRADASPMGADASSWATATPFLQDALDAAQFGDSIWIKQGVYFPTTSINRYGAFILKNGISLFGGFAGTETLLEQRDWDAQPTILSGDIGTPGDSTDNSYSIIVVAQTGLSTSIDGLILEDGNAGHPDNVNVFGHQRGHSGSAIYLNGQGSGNFAYMEITNCTFRNNRSDHFGAVYANGRDNGKATARFKNCKFENNQAFFKGGAVVVENYALQPEPLLIDHSTFKENYGRLGGGAIYIQHHQNVAITACQFERNYAFAGRGGAINLFGTNLSHGIRFEGCDFSGNYTTGTLDGGAVDFYPITSVTSLDFIKCSFFDNVATEGGCVNILNGNGSTCPVLFEQCLFVRNTASPGSVMSSTLLSPLEGLDFRNCLFHANGPHELFLAIDQTDTVKITNSILSLGPGNTAFHPNGHQMVVQHTLINRPDSSHFGAQAIHNSGNLFNSNAIFADQDQDNYRLSPCSPAINAGNNALVSDITTDLDGNPRIRAGVVDMGPYEHDLGFIPTSITPASCPEAFDGSVKFEGSNCAPLLIAWSMGTTSGSRTDSLAPGTYIFSFIDAAGHSAMDTVIIPSLPTLTLLPNVAAPVCVGASNGVAGVDISGGTQPYQISWDNGSSSNFLFNVPAGTYPVTVTDERGCLAAESVEVPEATPIEVFYTTIPATGPNQADGVLQIDSIWGCMGLFQSPDSVQTNLLPGMYTTGITDPCGCFALFNYSIGFVVSTEIPAAQTPAALLSPNPTASTQMALLEWTSDRVEAIWVRDALGRVVQRNTLAAGAQKIELVAPEQAGIYWLELRNSTLGTMRLLKWVVY